MPFNAVVFITSTQPFSDQKCIYITLDGVDDHPSSDVVSGSTRIEIIRIVIKNMTLRYAGGGILHWTGLKPASAP